MKIKLDNPNPSMGADEVDETNVNNIKQIRNTLNKTGVNQLLLVELATQTYFSNANYAVPVDMQGVITSSGGWVEIDWRSPQEYSAVGQLTNIRLLVDNEIKDFIAMNSPGFRALQTMRWAGTLAPGRHNVSIQLASNASMNLSPGGSITRLQVVETVL